LEILPTSMQLLNSLLKNLRRNFTQSGEFFLRFWQVIKLLNFAPEILSQQGRYTPFQESIYRPSTYGCCTNL
ncbi:MAG: hypothetical protein WBB43_27215, partial [Limnoraphis sp.]